MHVLQAVQDLTYDVDDGLLRELTRDRLQHGGKVASVHPLHNQVELIDAIFGPLVRLVDANDVLLALASHILKSDLCQRVLQVGIISGCDLFHRKVLLRFKMLH